MSTPPIRKGYVCFCGHANRFDSYVFAHYGELLKGKCAGCSRAVQVVRGMASPVRRRKSDPTNLFPDLPPEGDQQQQPMKKKPMNSSPRESKDPLTQQTPTRRRVYHGQDEKPAPKKKAPAKKPATKKPAARKPKAAPAAPEATTAETGKPVIPEQREDIQAPYHFTGEERETMNVGLRTALDDIEMLQSQAKAAAQDFKLRIQNRQNEAKMLRTKLSAGEETRPMRAAVQFEPARSMKLYLHPETGAFIREEPMQPADWQLPLFKKEPEPEPEKGPAAPAPAPSPAGKPAKAAKPPKSSPPGQTSLGDALDKAAAGTKAPQFWLDLDSPDWSAEGLTKGFKTAAKKAGWTPPQISALADRLKEAPAISAMIDTLRPFVISAEDHFVEVGSLGVKLPRVNIQLPDGFPLEKIAGTFRKAANQAEWPEASIDEVVAEAERQARVIGDEPEATETATRHLRNYCVETIATA